MRFLIVPLLALGTAVSADCPTANDLDTGIRFHIDGDETEVFRRLGNGLIEDVYTYSDGFQNRFTLAKGVYLLEIIDIEDGSIVTGSRETYSYPMSHSDLPDISPGGSFTSKATILDSEGLDTEIHQYSFGQMVRIQLGSCGYDMIPVDVTYPPTEDGPLIDHLHYLPELGLSYLAAGQSDGEKNTYLYYAIEKVN